VIKEEDGGVSDLVSLGGLLLAAGGVLLDVLAVATLFTPIPGDEALFVARFGSRLLQLL